MASRVYASSIISRCSVKNICSEQVGNQDFANHVDANVHLTHINNEEDLIPICPGMFLDFVHPSGEVHIQDSGEWAACPG
jgi:hypothetical protein